MLIRWILVLFYISDARALIEQIPLPADIKACFDEQLHPTKSVGAVIFTRCVQRTLWKRQASKEVPPLGDDAMKWISGLVEMNHFNAIEATKDIHHSPLTDEIKKRVPRQAPEVEIPRQPRVRKEYRMLTDRERTLFHRAMNMLKADKSVSPNKYDAMGRLHYMSVARSHFGPNFLPFHRLLLVIMENALREKIPSVTIPYWDTTLDHELRDPRSSVLWTPEFLGQANGFIIDGPFANWETPTGPLLRYFGAAGTMMNWTYIHKAFRQDHLENISVPFALPENNIEEQHNQVHQWVGGQMSPPALAAFDPVFYLLHSYVDLLWEIFRGLQKRRGIDPTTDYPMDSAEIPPGQDYNASSGFGSLLVRHGLSDVFTDNIYKYERPPTCSLDHPDCGSPYIRCDTSGPEPKCVSASIFDIRPLFLANGLPMNGGSGIRHMRSARGNQNEAEFKKALDHVAEVACQDSNVNEKFVNAFVIDGKADRSQWSYIPIEIVHRNTHSNSSTVSVYDICAKDQISEKSNRVFVESNGLNYNGMFKQVAHFRKDVHTDSTITYVGIKKPGNRTLSEVLISAYDVCGRVCQPYCPVYAATSRPCTGAIKISRDFPAMFSDDVTSVINTVWREDAYGMPRVVHDELFIRFVCDTNVSFWPWGSL
ncbi:uncharacterized protein LOC127838738 [Dreissena polymorpha]|uniref:Tyrosinase copper-binding domain-containing protein n=1 Tax=Dreissena polymorpha TaxID=45954 RepID=A0A9D4FNI9_DREPO|nr:uncharacterized protein LOC127838738 [Dreissena polymorpha]KAH3800443.1 hypothetical protein DPMN_154076 [Dreissena polymorpha]